MNLTRKTAFKIFKVLEKFYFTFTPVFPRPKLNANAKKTLDLYKDEFTRWFAYLRFWDSPFDKIEKVIPKSGVILDLGCGDAVLTNYLAISAPRRKMVGLELNERRVKEAYRGLKNTNFQKGNILKTKLPKADHFVIVHVLHHLPGLKEQEILLKRIYKMMNSKSKLVIVEIDKKPFIKYMITYLVDAFVVPLLFESKFYDFSFRYREMNDWKSLLKEIGFKVKGKTVDKLKPFSHIILECTI